MNDRPNIFVAIGHPLAAGSINPSYSQYFHRFNHVLIKIASNTCNLMMYYLLDLMLVVAQNRSVTTLRQRFASRIAELRRLSGMKIEGFAAEIGCSITSASSIERGKSFPKPERLEKIAEVLKVPLKELFDFGDSRFMPPLPPLDVRTSRRPYRRARRN
jgi:DNA-binding XRE family transcriptional regulator